MKLLYSLANEHYESISGNQLHLVEVVGKLCDHQSTEYERLLELIDNRLPASLLIQTIKGAQSRIHTLKGKYTEIDETEADTLEATTTASAGAELSPQQLQSPDSLSYEQGMQFVERFKQARIARGLTKMDWLTCLSEGQKKNLLLNYKNRSSLRDQFARFIRVSQWKCLESETYENWASQVITKDEVTQTTENEEDENIKRKTDDKDLFYEVNSEQDIWDLWNTFFQECKADNTMHEFSYFYIRFQ